MPSRAANNAHSAGKRREEAAREENKGTCEPEAGEQGGIYSETGTEGGCKAGCIVRCERGRESGARRRQAGVGEGEGRGKLLVVRIGKPVGCRRRRASLSLSLLGCCDASVDFRREKCSEKKTRVCCGAIAR